ncbi:MAG: glycoside hydrolase family 3 C-terminal domain-containing protein [Prevotellaceae bacterium]|jgi:beta-glucosidase|nr:glycoside hydrolase family 3 C-terminal domain-containing protein [Prevotellaceae bacterium]
MKQQHVLAATALLFTCFAHRANAQQLRLQPDNIDRIVQTMTLEEKAQLLVGGAQSLVPGAAGATQAITRLGIPQTILSDGPAGLRISPTRENDSNTYYATGFPVGTALASTWNTQLVEAVGKAIGEEVLQYGADVLLAPGMNLHRSPLCGRNFEYYSEDPIVTGLIATAYTKGVQSNGVGVSLKHFAVNSQETNRMGVDEIVSQRALRELYLKGFEMTVKNAHPWTIMSSYNRLNGSFTQESRELLTTILRDEWGFDGIVMTDWTGKRNTAAQIQAGNDLMEPGAPVQSEEIVAKVKSGELAIADVDLCVKRVLEYIVKTPRFKEYRYNNKPDLKAHAAITRNTATEGMVLLKNNNATLPLKGVKKIALFGITSYDFIAGGTGSGDVNKPYTIDLRQGLNGAGLEVTQSLEDLYLKYKAYQEARIAADRRPGGWFWGKAVLPEMSVSRNTINRQAQEAEVAVLTLGRQAGEGGDRKIDDDFNLTSVERQLLQDLCDAFHAAGKPVIVIINTGGVIETASWKALPDAILLAWQPGQEGGNSVADVLTGKENPSGKLTMTFPIAVMDHPSSLNFPLGNNDMRTNGKRKNVDYTLHQEDIYVGYRYFHTRNKEVSYPFGYGLSYTTFTYSKPAVKATADGFSATITVKNSGSVAGKEVVQLYVAAPEGGLEKPSCELKSFAKTRLLQPGEQETLTFKVSAYDLASFDEALQSWVSAKGKYTLQFGASVEDIRATALYNLAREGSWKAHDVLKPTMSLK